jgi:type ISP restriction-modification system protein
LQDSIGLFIPGVSFWSNVPETVWEYAIGGYQVLKKWLSYRERHVLGRDITKDEAREFTHIVCRIAALLLLEPELDKNYAAAKINSHRNKAVAPTDADVVPR